VRYQIQQVTKNPHNRMMQITDIQKIGVGLAGFGVAFLFLGVCLLFDKGLLAIGNILFLSGLACVIGLERTFRFFFQWHKAKGSGAFFGGILVVLLGWPIIGMCVELYGFVVLFRSVIIAMLIVIKLLLILCFIAVVSSLWQSTS